MNTVDVSIIIVNYNTVSFLENCIDSIIDNTIGISYEIIVVDNASTDGSTELVKRKFSGVKLFCNKENLGFGKANNIGATESNGRYLWFLNTDTQLLNNAARILFETLFENPKIGIAGGNLYTKDLSPNTSFSQTLPSIWSEIDYFFFSFFSKIYYRRSVNFSYRNHLHFIDGYISGADFMISKDIFLHTGRFDEDFFMYFEETELTHRIRKAGLKVAVNPCAKIFHFEGGSETKKEISLVRSFRSKYLYFKKTKAQKKITLIRFIFLMTVWQRIVLFKLTRNNDKLKYWRLIRKIEAEIFFEQKL